MSSERNIKVTVRQINRQNARGARNAALKGGELSNNQQSHFADSRLAN